MTTLRTGLRYREDFPLLCCQSVHKPTCCLSPKEIAYLYNRVPLLSCLRYLRYFFVCKYLVLLVDRTWDCFVRSVETAHLGPLLSHVIVALLPLIPLQPKETAAIIRFLILENR